MRPAAAEFLGTFGFLLLGGGASLASPSHWAPLAFGPAIGAMIYLFAPASGAHFNPAVTASLVAGWCFPARRTPGYVAAQLLGAAAAAGVLSAALPGTLPRIVSAPAPGVPAAIALAAEAAATLLLALVVLRASCGEVKRWDASLSIGGAVAAGILAAGPLSSASMNPARSLGPALVAGAYGHLWVYLLGPLAGGLLAALLFRVLGLDGRCREVLLRRAPAGPPGGRV